MNVLFYGANAAMFRQGFAELCEVPVEIHETSDAERGAGARALFGDAEVIVGVHWQDPSLEAARLRLFQVAAAGSRGRLAMAPSSPEVLYYLNSDATLHRSTDGGATWSLRSSDACQSQCAYNLSLAVDPADPAHLYRGDVIPHASTDGGATWSALTIYGVKLHPDVQHIEIPEADPGAAYFGTDVGLFQT